MTTIPVFAGPSLHGVVLEPPFERLPPAAVGDMLRLAERAPGTVVLVDGVFGTQLSVWHKEVLVLLARGWRVIGAASMGALRAAELHPYGMIGVGHIFRAYASGRITADDEVAVIHAPAELGAVPLNLAQVDVRATLVGAVRAGVLPVADARLLRAVSAAIFYRDRRWETVIAAGREAGLELVAFKAWVPGGAVGLKRADALEALIFAVQRHDPQNKFVPPPQTFFLKTLAEWTGQNLS